MLSLFRLPLIHGMGLLCVLGFALALGGVEGHLAQRTSRPHCWAQFRTRRSESLCVSRKLWQEWLRSPTPGPFTGQDPGFWKSYSPRAVTRDRASDAQKPVLLTRHVLAYQHRRDLPLFQSLVYTMRQEVERFRERFSEFLAPADSLGILRSLLLHEGVSQGALPMFRRLGFVHLVTASGIHLMAVMAWVQAVSLRVCSFYGVSVRLGLCMARGLSFGLCFGLWILGGARLGMLRPACVLVLREGAQWAGIRWKKAAPLGCALLLDGVVGGYRVFVEHQDFQSGRWIYALAVGGGLMWNQSLGRSHLGLALGSWALVAVWEAWETGWVALATPLLSWVTLPWVCGVVYPGTVLSLWLQDLGFSDLAQGLLRLFAGSLSFCILRLSECTVYSGEFWPGTLWRVSRGAVVVAVILASLMFFISHRLINRIKWGGLLAVGMLGVRVGLAGFVHDQGDTVADRVVQLDVGQGDSALVLGAKPGLIDVGSEHALKDEDWLSVFAFWGVSRLDWIGLTHLDEDHAGSLVRLSRLIRIGCVASSAAEVSSDRGQVLKAALAAQGVTLESWEEGCVPFSVLGPVPGVSRHAKGGNQQMSALWIPLRAGGFYLSAGDADRESELRIGNWASRLADAHVSRLPGADDVRGRRILKISHHGSRYSTSADWLKKIHPSEVWISVGQGNRYGHPSVQTLDLLKHFDVKVRRTDQSGSLD